MSDPTPDPLASLLRPLVEPTIDFLVHESRRRQRYRVSDFPMRPDDFAAWREQTIATLARMLDLADWRVAAADEPINNLAGRFEIEPVKTLEHHGIVMQVMLIILDEPAIRVPAVVCLPPEVPPESNAPLPGVACFSGHGPHGLNDLVVNLDSYQAGMATRLAKAGFVAIAVEKIDSGYLSRGFTKGVDEPAVATHHLAWGRTTRAVQLKACLAACEILATHPRVDPARIGATGTSLGGWLSMECALLTDRIKAVADFGRKTVHLPDDLPAGDYQGIRDYCHIEPGMLAFYDRNIHTLAYAPRPLLAGHGQADEGCVRESPHHFQQLYAAQYAALDAKENYEYHTHPGGDVTPPDAVIEYFNRVL